MKVEVEIYIGQLNIRHRVLVVGVEEDFILGMDLISCHRLIVDSVENILRLGNVDFVLNQNCIDSKPVRLTTCHNVKVIENGEIIVPVRGN